jgi:hypothetical protein
MPTVNRDELIRTFVETVPRQDDVGVRQGDSFEMRVVEIGCGRSGSIPRVVEPVVIEGENVAPGWVCGLRPGSRALEQRQREG